MNFDQHSIDKPQQFTPIEDVKKDWGSAPTETFSNKNVRMRRTALTDDTEFTTLKGRKLHLTIVSGAYSVQPTDSLVAVRSVTVAPVMTLPKASRVGMGKLFFIKDLSGSAFSTSITISPQSGETINGDTGTAIATNYGFAGFFSDGSNWFVQ